MSLSSQQSRRRLSVLAGCAFLAIGAATAIGLSTSRRAMVAPAPAEVKPVVAQAPVAPPSAATAPKPSFDVVRVAPDGSAVLAGRAAPGSTVTVEESGHTVGQVQADARGAWVMLPDAKLAPGAGALTLASRFPNGVSSTAEAPVVVVVPTPAAPSQPQPQALAVLTPPAAPSRLLQAPGAAPAQRLGLDTVDYDEHGAIRFSGTAPPQSPVRAYVDNGRVGDATADPSGHWVMSPPHEVEPGVHDLRVDQLTPQGQVANRIELPFKREEVALASVGDDQVVVQPGQNLWRLARRAYGAGIRYTVIFQANREQIRDARLIYPGQVFATPGAANPAITAMGLTH